MAKSKIPFPIRDSQPTPLLVRFCSIRTIQDLSQPHISLDKLDSGCMLDLKFLVIVLQYLHSNIPPKVQGSKMTREGHGKKVSKARERLEDPIN